MSSRLLLVIASLLLMTCLSGYGQHYIFNRLSISDGLLSNNVRAVWQDSTGYLWIGSRSGLQRYDGTHMRTVFREGIDQLLADGSGRVWVRAGSRVKTLNLRTFELTPVSYEGSEEMTDPAGIALRKDSSGGVYLVTVGKSFQYFSRTRGRFSTSQIPFLLPDSLRVSDMIDDPFQNRYWIVSQNGFGYWDKKAKTYYSSAYNPQRDPLLAHRLKPALISKFFIDGKKRYWILPANQPDPRFLCFNAAAGEFEDSASGFDLPVQDFQSEVYGFTTYEDSITLAYGLNCFRALQKKTFFDLRTPVTNPYGIQFNSISGLFEDKEGFLWIATDNGLFYTPGNKRKYTHIVLSQEKERGSINALLEDRQGNLWIGTRGRGTFLLRNENSEPDIRPVSYPNPNDNNTRLIWSLCEDNLGRIWTGFEKGRLAIYDPKTEKTVLYLPKDFQSSDIRQMAKDQQGLLWLGLQNGDIFVCNPWEPFSEKSMKKVFAFRGTISRMVPVHKSQLWVASVGKGVYVVDIHTRRILHLMDARNTPAGFITSVRDILPLSDSTCLIAGEKLAIVDSRTFKVNLNIKHTGDLSGTLFTLQKDRESNWWIGSTAGISKLNPGNRMLTRYGQQDGLITVHNNSDIPEVSAGLRSGRIAFGGNQHLVIFNPAEYSNSPRPPMVTITGFQLNDRYLPADSLALLETIALPYGYSSFEIAFAAISFARRGRFTYEYKLEGLDTQWTTLTAPSPVRYNFLPHGHHRFLVRVKNELGQYQPHTTALNLYVKPPFWKTLWFYALVVLMIGAVLYYLHLLRVQKLLHIEKVRSRLARDLHDDMGSTLSTINILSNLALRQKSLDEDKAKQYMNTISQSTQQMMESMDDIVWSINPVNDSIGKIMARMKETAGAVLEPRQIDYSFTAEPSVVDLHLPMEARREIFLIFKEALNNIVKYANCTLVQFTIEKKGADLELTIYDNGIGFQMEVSASSVRGNGLKNMRKRAEQMNGTLAIASEPGNGTRLQLIIPIA